MKNKKLPLLIGFIILLIALYNLYFANIIKIFSIINPFCVFICVKFFRGSYDVKIDENTAIHFEKYMKRYPQLYQYLADIVKKNITDDIKKPVILDLGVGPGLLSKEINKVLPEAHIIGVDPSEEMLKLSKKNAYVETKVGGAENIPMENNSVDVVVCRFNLSYWEDLKKGFSEVNRVLKPGGKFVIEALNKDFSYLKLFVTRIFMILKGSGFDIARYHSDAYKTAYSMDCIKKLFRDASFEIVYTEGEKKDWRYVFVGKKIDT